MTAPTDHTQWATWAEVVQQPRIWRDWAGQLDIAGLQGWIDGLDVDEVWFAGAGTSAFIGDILATGLEGRAGPSFRSVPTTDIVLRPAALLTGRRPLVVSFGRSGNSAETIGTLDALDALAPDAPRLNITCNAQSALATRQSKAETRVIVLPSETHDAGFAMTSSFSTMLLTALALFDRQADAGAMTQGLARDLERRLRAGPTPAPLPARAVYLGTGPLMYAGREAALKVLELTAGAVPTLWDSPLGFRHGPKSFVDDGTRITLFGASDPHARRYEADLIAEIGQQFPGAALHHLPADPGGRPDVWQAALAVAQVQIEAVLWSHAMGLNVDDPFQGKGTLTRVVADVPLYAIPA